MGSDYVVSLKDAGQVDPIHVGSKAARLGELMAVGFPVPEGRVLLADAFDRFMVANGINMQSPPDSVLDSKLPADVKEAIRAISVNFGDAPLAVRSSGIAEDLSGASFAGQYETILGVRGMEALEKSTLHCWASAFSPRVAAYRKAKAGSTPRISMAVLVQRLVNADSAGVAFTANPVSGDRNELVVNAVKGLGERLVSGKATPDEWVVRGSEAMCKSAAERSITGSQALAVAELAQRVERHFGYPQDIEWAFEGETLFLLQARPITALQDRTPTQAPIAVEVPEGFWQREDVSFPHALRPIDESVIPETVEIIEQIIHDLYLPFERIEFKSIGGWVYVRIVPPGGKDRSPPPGWLMPLLFKVVPQMRAMAKGCAEAVRTDLAGRTIDRWYDEWRPEMKNTAQRLRDVDLAGLSDIGLEEHLSQAFQFFLHGTGIHFRGIFLMSQPLYEFATWTKRLLGYDDRKIVEMLSGLSRQSSEPSRRMSELTQMAVQNSVVGGILRDGVEGDTLLKLTEADGEFARVFDAYQREFGARTVAYEFESRTLAEDPVLTLQLIKNQMGKNMADSESAVTQLRETTVSEARKQLKSNEDRREFERLLVRAARAYPILDDTQFYVCLSRGQVRYALLEAGRRFVTRGLIEGHEDVFFLKMHEVRDALRGLGKEVDLRNLIRQRREEVAWAEAHPGPKSYGKQPPPPPSVDSFPKEVQFIVKSFMWQGERFLTTPTENKLGSVLTGIGVSAGTYTGPVHVIMGEEEFDNIRAGDVLVCTITSPVWSVLFTSIGALVTDRGGLLSHPAILAREYHIPAVVATGNGTRLLRDGQMVTVDGDRGEVTVNELPLSSRPAGQPVQPPNRSSGGS